MKKEILVEVHSDSSGKPYLPSITLPDEFLGKTVKIVLFDEQSMKPKPLIHRILELIRLRPVTVAQVAECLSCAISTVRKLVQLLTLTGEVQWTSMASTGRHRPARIYSACPFTLS